MFQFRNYLRAVVNAFVIGHVTPFLYKQPCFECTEVFFIEHFFHVILFSSMQKRGRQEIKQMVGSHYFCRF